MLASLMCRGHPTLKRLKHLLVRFFLPPRNHVFPEIHAATSPCPRAAFMKDNSAIFKVHLLMLCLMQLKSILVFGRLPPGYRVNKLRAVCRRGVADSTHRPLDHAWTL